MSPLEQLLAHAAGAPPSCGPVHVIGIDGRSGSGKTSLARRLARRWEAPVLSMDSLYPGWSGLAAATPLLVEHVLLPLSRGDEPLVPTWDWLAERPGPRLPLPVSDRLVVEGCGATVGPAAPFVGTRAWLEGPAGLRRERAIARDGAVFASHWEMWARQEEAVFTADRTRERAHVVLTMAQVDASAR
ncbi:(d)CMP kinase [Janibacter terrae]|uniref:(D)CMP kinase n=1 Tax=Janibacter terrae TaxID=103817 RepID=A0ABZ2FCA4_9MICO